MKITKLTNSISLKRPLESGNEEQLKTVRQVLQDVRQYGDLAIKKFSEMWEEKVGTFDTELVHEFLWKFALEARMNVHVIVPYGHNTHHIIEAIFKALARAIDDAVQIDPRVKGVPSTKGLLT
ncbi:Imidazoleglycerol-phosphate dehydratase [Ureibacillus acetophenoni]